MNAPSKTLIAMLWCMAAGILTQAVLAGLFISGVAPSRMAHLIVGALLPYLAVAAAVLAVVQRRRGRVPGGVAGATVALPFILFVQEALGHMPGGVPTAIHVPFGVALLTYAVVLALACGRGPGSAITSGSSPGAPRQPTSS